MNDLWGKALLDYYHGHLAEPLILHTSFGDPEEVPLDVFFRESERFSDLEHFALSNCEGPVLDIGAGTGVHAMYLQDNGIEVTTLEQSAGACGIMRKSDLSNVITSDVFSYQQGGYKTALILMNGLGIAGTLKRLPDFLDKIFSLLNEDGQILADSCDIKYLYEGKQLPSKAYYGELVYSYQYKGLRDPSFPWLFVDADRLKIEAEKVGLSVQVLFHEEYQYLARITRS